MNSVQLVKAAKDLASRGYGESAASVLNTGKRLAEIQEKISADDFRVFRDQVAWHPKVFSKVLTIGKDSRLTKYCKDLPDSYSAIYAISLLTDEDFAAAVKEGVVSSTASVRFITDWSKTRHLHGNAVVDEIPIVLTARKSLGEAKTAELLDALKNTAAQFGASIRTGSGTKSEVIAEERESIADALLEGLTKRMGVVVKSSDPQLCQQFGVKNGSQLARAEMRVFTGFLVKTTGSSSAMWERHGTDYCEKVSFEFNSTDSRAQRFNYKKRLLEVKERHPQLGSVVDKCLENYCN